MDVALSSQDLKDIFDGELKILLYGEILSKANLFPDPVSASTIVTALLQTDVTKCSANAKIGSFASALRTKCFERNLATFISHANCDGITHWPLFPEGI